MRMTAAFMHPLLIGRFMFTDPYGLSPPSWAVGRGERDKVRVRELPPHENLKSTREEGFFPPF